RVEGPVHDDDPTAGAGPEGDHGEDVGKVPRSDRLREDARPEHVAQQEGPRADRRVEHEEPDDDCGRAGKSAGYVEEEPVRRRHPGGASVEKERKADDEDHQGAEPDDRVDEDVLERGYETEVVVRPDEVVEPDPTASCVREGEVERVDRRRDPEDDQERQVGKDERGTARDAEATRTRGLHVLRSRSGSRKAVACSRPYTRPPLRCSRVPCPEPAGGCSTTCRR